MATINDSLGADIGDIVKFYYLSKPPRFFFPGQVFDPRVIYFYEKELGLGYGDINICESLAIVQELAIGFACQIIFPRTEVIRKYEFHPKLRMENMADMLESFRDLPASTAIIYGGGQRFQEFQDEVIKYFK